MSDVVKRDENELATYDYGEDAGVGMEMAADERIIPFIGLAQQLSHECEEGSEKFIEGVKPGILFLNDGTILGREVTFVPALKTREIVEWIPRSSGGGFVARYALNDPFIQQVRKTASRFGPMKNPKTQNDLVDTTYVFGVITFENADPLWGVFSLSSSKLGPWRKFLNSLDKVRVPGPGGTKIQPPLFGNLVKVGTKLIPGKKGTYWNLTFSPANETFTDSLLKPDDPRFTAAKALADMVKAGEARAADEAPDTAEVEDDGSDGPF